MARSALWLGRFNLRALVVSLAAVVVIVGVGLVLTQFRSDRLRTDALRQLTELIEQDKPELAVRHLNRYLVTWPDDVKALEIKADLLGKRAGSMEQLLDATQTLDRLVKLDPDGPNRQETRQKLAELNILYSDIYRTTAAYRNAPELAGLELRYQAAEAVARQIVDRDPNSVAGHRLIGLALENVAGGGNQAALDEAVASYEAALRLDPGDRVSAERLANLCRDRLGDPARADRILDALLAANPRDIQSRLVRYRYFAAIPLREKALAELEEAARLAPDDVSVRLTLATDALQRGDIAAARQQVDAMPEAARDNIQVQLVRGLIDFGDQRSEEAIAIWRESLARTGGTIGDLTWWLAYVLLQSDRIGEAMPLIDQFVRIVGDEEDPLAQFLKALADERANRPLRAIAILEKIRARVDENRLVLLDLLLGRCYEAIWDEDKALAAYRRAGRLDPNAPLPRMAEARLLARRRPGEAGAILKSAADQPNADPVLLITRARALLRELEGQPEARRNWAEFDALMKRLDAPSVENPAIALLRADRLILSGRPAEALPILRDAAGRYPRDPSVWIALASVLDRSGKPEEALQALDAASAPEALGDLALVRIARARLLTAMGRGRDGRAQLIRDIDALPLIDRAQIWEVEGGLLAAQGDFDGARKAYLEWSKLQPESPAPRLALLDVALAQDDDQAVGETVEEMRQLRGSDDITWRLCRALELLKGPDAETRPKAGLIPQAKLDEAEALLDELQRDAPGSPAVAVLQGRLREQIGQVDKAAADYRRAWEGGVDVALPRLVNLLVEHQRADELEKLRQVAPPALLDRLLAAAYLRAGDQAGAATVARRSPQARSAGADDAPWRAQVLTEAGKLDEAEALLRAAAEQSGGRETAWLELLRFLAETGRTASIPQTVAQVKARVKSDDPAILDALCSWAIRDWAAADRAFAQLLARFPDRPDYQLAAAQYFQETDRPADAIVHLRKTLELAPERRPVARQLATLLAADPARWAEAWDLLEGDAKGQPEADAPTDPEERLARAIVLARCPDAGRREGAVERLETLIADLPPESNVVPAARGELIRLLLREGKPDRAARIAGSQAGRGADAGEIALHVEALIQARDFDQAERQLDRLAQLAPADGREPRLRVRLVRERAPADQVASALEQLHRDAPKGTRADAIGREVFALLYAMGDPADAAAERVARALAAESPAASWALARVLARRGNRSEALEYSKAAIKAPADSALSTDPQEIARSVMEATAMVPEPALWDDAAAVLKATLERDPRSVPIHIMSAMLAHLQARYEDEARLYKGLLALQPANPLALNNLAWVLGEDLNRPAEGLPVIEQLIRNAGPTAQTLSTRGIVRLRAGMLPEAIRDLEEAVRLNPLAINHYYLGLAHQKAGNADAARKSFDAARQAGFKPADVDPPHRAEAEKLLAR